MTHDMFLIQIWTTQSVLTDFQILGCCQVISILAQVKQKEEEKALGQSII